MQIGQIKHFDQLFVISHDDTFEGYVDNVVTIERGEEGDELALTSFKAWSRVSASRLLLMCFAVFTISLSSLCLSDQELALRNTSKSCSDTYYTSRPRL